MHCCYSYVTHYSMRWCWCCCGLQGPKESLEYRIAFKQNGEQALTSQHSTAQHSGMQQRTPVPMGTAVQPSIHTVTDLPSPPGFVCWLCVCRQGDLLLA
jgi:hypothetical protein